VLSHDCCLTITFKKRREWPALTRKKEQRMSVLVNTGKKGSSVFILLMIFLLFCTIAGSAFYYRYYEKEYRGRVESQLAAIAGLKVSDLVNWRKERLSNAALFYHNRTFAGLIRRYFTDPRDSDARTRLQNWLGKLAENSQYDRVFLLDTAGNDRMSVPGDREPVAAHLKKDAAGVLRSGGMSFVDFHRDAPDRPIYCAVLVPVFDGRDDNRPLSVLVIRIDPGVYLYPFIQQWPVPSKTSETLIARREGNAAVFLNELRFQKNTALKMRVPLDSATKPVVQAVLGYEGIMEGIDYRGQRVLAALSTVPGSPWILEARTDIAEVYVELRRFLLQLAVFLGIVLSGMGVCIFLLFRQRTMVFYRDSMRFYRDQLASANALRESEEKYRTLVDNAGQAVLVAQDGMLRFVNHKAVEFSGHPEADLMSRQFQEFIHPDDRQMVVDYYRKRMSGQPGPSNYYFRLLRADGSVKWVEISPVLIAWEGRPATLNFLTDVTERRKAEEQIRTQREEISHVNRMASLGELAASLAHEIHQPLAAILSNAQAAVRFMERATPDLKEVREALDDIIRDDQRAGSVIRELRELMSKEEPLREFLDISRVIGDAINLTRGDFQARNIKITGDLAGNLPPVKGSRVQMTQVLINLFTNGFDAMSGTEPAERVLTVRAYAEDPKTVVIEVLDCGQGLQEGTPERIFRPFFTTKPGGMGMGLTISKTIIEAHGGSLTARNNPDKGAAFRVTMPAAETVS
jgi:PAS domain S-box-containing protein